MKLYYYLLLVLSLLAFTGCDDDSLQQPDPVGDEENDSYRGNAKSFLLGAETSGLTSSDITFKILAPDGSIISRHGSHRRDGNVSRFTLASGLKDGTYRLLYIEYPITDNPELAHLVEKYPTTQYGLGCRISVNGQVVMVCDGFDDGIGLAGAGTESDPYIISSYSHLIKLMKYVNSYETNKKVTSTTYFKQTNPIDMEQASFECDMRYGWYPIGADTNTPFRGIYKGDELSYLWIDRPNSPGMGLFGFVYNATIDSITMSHAEVKGNFAVGSLVGAAISGGDVHGKSTITNCKVMESTISGSTESFAIGGILGAGDMYSQTLVQKCESTGNSISGSYNVGGLVGGCGRFSTLTIGDCTNSSQIASEFSGTGGIVGTADTLYVVGCKNQGNIHGAMAYSAGDKNNSGIGTGGICGGSGISWLSACTNSGEIKGAYGVGGIIGSTRIKGGDGDAYVFNNTLLRWCHNAGIISGLSCVGGMCGEAQFGCYGVLNTGSISGGDYTAGIVGNTSIVVAHNAVNSGTVTGGSYCSGIVGKTTWGSVALDHNYGKVTGSGSHTAGILGMAGNNTIIHYCGNFGTISGSSDGLTGGIVAEVGDPRKWSAMNITECVVGSLEIVMAFAGPTIAVVEHVVEEASETAAIILKVTEFAADAILVKTDKVLAAYGLHEILSPEEAEALEGSIHGVADNVSADIKSRINSVRTNFTDFSIGDFDKTGLTVDYLANLNSTLNWYETGDNDEIFNEKINKRREDRMEELEKAHHNQEVIHEIVAGITIAGSTVAMVCSAVATGGAAVPFIVAGSVCSVVGGLNAISKAVTDFEQNAVVISQCINSGTVMNGKEVAGIVGRLQDNSLLTDCLNTANIKEPLVSDPKSKTRVECCMVLNDTGGNFTTGDVGQTVYYKPSSVLNDEELELYANWGALALSIKDIADVSVYNRDGISNGYYWEIHWSIGGEKSKWKMSTGSGNGFPVPSYSEMRN